MNPFFSVIIPLYNKENYIEQTLKSVLNQTFQDFEIIIVNDGSTDSSMNIISSFKDPRIQIINKKNEGLSTSRNKGISLAKGIIIALLDADDYWNKTFLNEIYFLYNKFPEASLYGTDYFEKYNDKNILEPKKNLSKSLKNEVFIVDDFFEACLFQPIVSQSNFAFKKNIFEIVKFNEAIDFAEDIEFYIKSNLKYKFAYSYKALATVNFSIPNQMTANGFYGKRLPNFNSFENEAKLNSSLKIFLDYNRYFFMINAKISKDKINYQLLNEKLDIKNLTLKQNLLLKSPLFILIALKKLKKIFLKYNIRFTSY